MTLPRYLALDRIEKADELLVPVARHAAADHPAVEDVEGGEQGGGAMALVVVRPGAGLARFQRQAGLGAVEGLDLALFVDREDQAVGRRVDVQPDDLAQLLDERRIVRALEGPKTVRLEVVLGPDPLHRAEGDAGLLGHRPAGPMGGFAGRLGTSHRHHSRDRVGRQRCRSRRPRLVAQQAVHALLGEPPLPAPHRRPADAGAPGHLRHRQPLRRQQHDPCPLHVLVAVVAIPDDCLEPGPIVVAHDHRNLLCHVPSLPQAAARVNPLSQSMH
jgi:hypothetical protein